MAIDQKKRQIASACATARRRARLLNLPFNIDTKYLQSIAGNECPIFRTPLVWGYSGLGRGRFLENGPQLDRIVPELGYVVGNVAFISHRANRIKSEGSMVEHYAIADWIWEQTRAKKKPTTSVSTEHDQQSPNAGCHGAIYGAGAGQDSNSVDNHCGTIQRQDPCGGT